MLIKKRGSKKPLNIILMVYLHDLTEDRGTDTYERPTIEMIPNFLVVWTFTSLLLTPQ